MNRIESLTLGTCRQLISIFPDNVASIGVHRIPPSVRSFPFKCDPVRLVEVRNWDDAKLTRLITKYIIPPRVIFPVSLDEVVHILAKSMPG